MASFGETAHTSELDRKSTRLSGISLALRVLDSRSDKNEEEKASPLVFAFLDALSRSNSVAQYPFRILPTCGHRDGRRYDRTCGATDVLDVPNPPTSGVFPSHSKHA
jgi:hypothetical protein